MNLPILLQYAWMLIAGGTPYHWGAEQGGGDDPILGFDCSGYCSELLRAAGILGYQERLSAQAIYDRLANNGSVGAWGLGSFSFYGKDVRSITHIGFCIDGFFMLEFGGGDHTTATPVVAATQNAFGRLRPIRFRKDFLQVVKPFYVPG